METVNQKPWPGFGYVPVRGLADRLIARHLRKARKDMTRLFRERGLFDLVERMERIRKSNQNMMAKNQAFQRVLDAYAKSIRPPTPAGDTPKAADLEGGGDAALAVPAGKDSAQPGVDESGGSGSGADAAGGVPELEAQDAGLVIEE